MSRLNESAGADHSESATDSLKEKAAEVKKTLRDIGGQVRDAANEKYDQARDQAADYYNQGREAAVKWENSLESYVQEKPLKAVLIAAGVGVLLGILWKRS